MDMADKFFLTILGRLDEAQACWYVAREALALGRGGVTTMEKVTGISRPRILRGIRELKEDKLPPAERVRRVGGGRKRLEQHDPKLMIAIENWPFADFGLMLELSDSGGPQGLLHFCAIPAWVLAT